jgi:hypothetical protein
MLDAVDTIFSLTSDVPRALRGDPGDPVETLQPGAVARGSLREICFLRKITAAGAVVHLDAPIRVGERLDLALMSGEELEGVVDWVEGQEVGLRFEHRADVFALIARNLVQQPGDARRMPRIELRCRAWLTAGSRRERVTVTNLSDGGAGIVANLSLVPYEQVELQLDDFPAAPATVRWVDGELAGLAFTPPVSWQALMPWLKRHQECVAVARAPSEPQPDAGQADAASSAGEEAVRLSLAARVREGTRRWTIDIESIDTHQVRFTSYAALEPGRLFWISLPGLEGWPARITEIDGYSVTCALTQPLHPAVLERVLAEAKRAA